MTPKLSVCIPVYNSEPYLSFCLESVANQTFSDYEIVLVGDGSEGKNEQGQNCKQIVKSFCKNHKKIKVNFIQHSKNLGLFEARKTAVFNAKGKYVFILDSDDFLHPDALETVYTQAVQNNADIVQIKLFGGSFPNDEISGPIESFLPAQVQKLTAIYSGVLLEREIFTNLIVEKTIASCLIGKLFNKEMLVNVYNQLPFMKLNFQEDLLVFFFVSLAAKKYVGLREDLYFYRQTSGMTSGAEITSLEKWQMHCSTASVYNIIFQYIDENKDSFSDLEIAHIQQRARIGVRSAITSLHTQVTPSLRPQARQMLNEYWGKGLVDRVENQIKEEMQQNDKPTN